MSAIWPEPLRRGQESHGSCAQQSSRYCSRIECLHFFLGWVMAFFFHPSKLSHKDLLFSLVGQCFNSGDQTSHPKLFCIFLDSLHLSPHIPILCRKQFSLQNNYITLKYYIRKRIYNHNVTITQSETLETAFESVWPLCVVLCTYNTFKMEMHMVTCLFPFNNLAVTFSIITAVPPIKSKLLICPSVYLWFANLIFSCFSGCLCFKWTSFLHILKDINHSTSEEWVGFFYFVTF